uniref:Uncharacterized protein n=1 Tax=Rangifer tarandus platyrhynchus TaxID=3082113 RepID=A0ACB0E893_RANTA|nr:unnamed protein product [Rangifer tarandus platyrhynchus]
MAPTGCTWPVQPATGTGVEIKDWSPKTAKSSSPTPENASLYRTKGTREICRSRAQRGRPRHHGQNTGPSLSWVARQLRGRAGSPRPDGPSWSRVAGSLRNLAQQPWAPLRAPPRPESTLHSSQGGFAAQPHACSAALESEPGGSSVGGRWA